MDGPSKAKIFLIIYSRLLKLTVNGMPVHHKPAVTELPLTKHYINVIYNAKKMKKTTPIVETTLTNNKKTRNQSISAMMSLRMNLMKKKAYTALQQMTRNSFLNLRKCISYDK